LKEPVQSRDESAIRLRFWGVRGSIPTPGPGTVRYGGNTSCVTVETPLVPGSPIFILDAGSGIRELGLALMREKRLPLTAHLLLTHTHWDHIQGFPFFVPAFIPGNRVTVYGSAGTDNELVEALEGQMLYRYFPVSLDKLGAALDFHHVDGGSHQIGDARVTVAPLHHPGTTVGYRLEIGDYVIAYVTDAEPQPAPADFRPDPEVLRLARDADVLIHDAQYTDAEFPAKVGWGHSPTSYVVMVAQAARVKHLLLFHHDPTRTDEDIDAIVHTAREQAQRTGTSLRIDAAAEGRDLLLPAGAGRV
jgi:phosphoribosyl 1,2-cyclic phosphodiesterase